MAQPEPAPPNQRRPWYYQNWFLIAAFILGWPVVVGPPFGVLWPVWGVLMLRSPWHNPTLLKGLGWAMLVVGSIMIVKTVANDQDTLGLVIATLIPGLLVTLATQVMWTRYKLEHGLGGAPQAPQAPQAPSVVPPVDSPSLSRRSRARRRVHRRRGSRSGGSPQ